MRSMGFNPRARTGRDSGLHDAFHVQDGFNPRARTGRDQANERDQAS